ncbi:MAG TPA: hypothetical protein VN622_10890 [Clostridia bacterium]|nr:hypothetical protein [Clostridia bacterium]
MASQAHFVFNGDSFTSNGGDPQVISVKFRDRATFVIGLGGSVSPADDITNHYPVRKAGTFIELVAYAKAAIAEELHFDILRSRDSGATWTSILTGNLVIPSGSTSKVQVTSFNASANSVAVDDLLRLDLKSGHAQGVTIVLSWS